MTVKLLTEQHLELLRLKGGCTGSSESILVKMPHCWKLYYFLSKRWHCTYVCANSPSQIDDLIFENRWYDPTGDQTKYLPYQLI